MAATGDDGKAWPRPLLLILAGAALARFIALDRQSFWYDEAVSVVLARQSIVDLLGGRVKDLGNPPLYPVLLHLWMGLVGTSDAAIRALPALLGTATVPLVYLVGRRALDRRTALWGTGLFALAPYQLQLAQEARAYTLLTLTGLGAGAALLWALERPRRWTPWLLYGLATAAMLLTHYFGVFVALAMALYLVWTQRGQRAVLARGAVGLALGAAVAAFWLPSLVEQLSVPGNLMRSPTSWYRHLVATPMVFAVGSTLVWKDSVSSLRMLLALALTGVVVALLVIGIWRARRRPGAPLLLLLWLVVPIAGPALLSALASPLYNTRYVILASVPFYLFVAAGLLAIGARMRAVGVGVLAAGAVVSQASYLLSPFKHQWRQAAAQLEAELRPLDLILFEVDFNETAYAHYARRPVPRLRLLPPPPDAPPGRLYAAEAEGAPALDVSERVRAQPRVWLVLSDATLDGAARARRFLSDRHPAPPSQYRGITVQLFERR
jgi:uncharacterized membrane protein